MAYKPCKSSMTDILVPYMNKEYAQPTARTALDAAFQIGMEKLEQEINDRCCQKEE